jgi:solute carrier family 13 (sodium-dependent dicarboxylate transporter), member 2/3/5
MNRADDAPDSSDQLSHSERRLQRIGMISAIAAFAFVLLLPTPEGLSPAGQRLGAVTVMMAVLWVTQAIPIAATALIPLAAYPLLGIQSARDVSPAYVDASIWLFFGGFVIALGIEKWGLHRRIALHIVHAIGASPRLIVLGFMISTAFLSMWISNTASTMLMLPIALALLSMLAESTTIGGDAAALPERFEAGSRPSTSPEAAIGRLGIAMMLGIAYSASVGGLSTLVGTPTNIAYLTQARQLFPDLPVPSMGEWLIIFLPLSGAMLAAAFVVLTWRLPRTLGGSNPSRSFFREQIAGLGRPSAGERAMMIIFAATAALWIFRKPLVFQINGESTTILYGWGPTFTRFLTAWLHVDAAIAPDMVQDATVAMLMSLLMFAIAVPTRSGRWERLIDWPTVEQKMPWGILLLLGGGFAMAGAFGSTGLSEYIGSLLATTLEDASPVVLIAAICLLMTFLTEFTSNVATVNTLMPILAGTAVALELDPRLVMIPATVTASCAFMLPIATPPNAIVFASGRVSMRQMIAHGFVLNIIGVALVVLVTFWLLVPTLGIAAK